MALERLNSGSKAEVVGTFLSFLGSQQFAGIMEASRPFASVDDVIEKQELAYKKLLLCEWETAFNAHLRIGHKGLEQRAAIANARPELRERLVATVREYEDKFGFKFLVFAPGKSAADLLAACEARLPNPVLEELLTASRQAADIANFRARTHLA